MNKKNKLGVLGATAIALATALGGAQQANAVAPVTLNASQHNKKEAIPQQVKPVQAESKRNAYAGIPNLYKHVRTPKKNQRQVRKWKRQNPNATK